MNASTGVTERRASRTGSLHEGHAQSSWCFVSGCKAHASRQKSWMETPHIVQRESAFSLGVISCKHMLHKRAPRGGKKLR